MNKLEKMLAFVSEHNNFYKDRIKRYDIRNPLDINQWPILTRKDVQENRYNMFSDGYIEKYYGKQLKMQASSGSTGMPVYVYWDFKDWYASNMALWRKRFQWYKVRPSDKKVIFTLNTFDCFDKQEKPYYIKESNNVLSFDISLFRNEKNYDEMISAILDFQPDWLYIQPFVLRNLIQAYKEKDRVPPKTIKYIESVGEMLPFDLRHQASELFNIPITNMYGSEEMNGIAIENPKGDMLVLDENAFVEVKDKTRGIGEFCEGELIVTNLNNFAMPLIRYSQNDDAIIATQINNHGNSKKTIINAIKGRSFESIKIENTEINALKLASILSNINEFFHGIIAFYKFVYYKSSNRLIGSIGLSRKDIGWFKSIQAKMKQALFFEFQSISNLSIDILFQENNILDYTKKYNFFEIVD